MSYKFTVYQDAARFKYNRVWENFRTYCRTKSDISMDRDITEFNGKWIQADTVIFDTEEDATAFVLRFS